MIDFRIDLFQKRGLVSHLNYSSVKVKEWEKVTMYSCLMCVCTAMMLCLTDFVGCTLRQGDASFQ